MAPGPEVHGCAFNVSFLVDRDESDAFRETVRKFADAHRDRAEIRVAGPLPCYSFVSSSGLRPTAARV